ncbi:MAG: hypothetical protein AAGF36_06140 [Pseudomonadota bacterium]
MTIFTDLLRMDEVARPYGSGLHPRLRAAIEADLSWPSTAAAPVPTEPVDPGVLSDNVVPLAAPRDVVGQKQA